MFNRWGKGWKNEGWGRGGKMKAAERSGKLKAGTGGREDDDIERGVGG